MAARRVRKPQTAAGFFMMFGAIWLAVGLVFLIAGLFMFRSERAFKSESVAATATVDGKNTAEVTETRRSSSGSTRRRTRTAYYVEYSFLTADGQEIRGRREVDDSEWKGLERGQSLQVAYLPSDPSNNRLADEDERIATLVFAVIGLVLSVVGAVIVLKAWASGRSSAQLRERGVAVGGVIKAVENKSLKINGRPQSRILYEYRDYQGRLHQGRSRLLPRSDAVHWQAGQAISVKYNPDRPSDSVWVEEQDLPAGFVPPAHPDQVK